MRSQTTQLRSQQGFSLIELMVVVGIIGILAAIAVPNFQRFQAKSRQSEAKANLGGLYTAQKAFYAEWNRYFGPFRHIGFSPEGNLRYRVGFTQGGEMPGGIGYTGPGCPDGGACSASQGGPFASNTYCPTTQTGTQASVCNETDFAKYDLPTAIVAGGQDSLGGQTFTAGAAGNIDSDPTIDQWTIDHQKNLLNIVSDLAQ